MTPSIEYDAPTLYLDVPPYNTAPRANTFFGVCSTSAQTQEKKVSIPDFTTANLIDGTRVVVLFSNSQDYNGAPTLNVSNTGAKTVKTRTGKNAEKKEWMYGQTVPFIYYGGNWVIEDGAHASDGGCGKVNLTSDFSNLDITSAASASMVTSLAGQVTRGWLWDGNEHEPTVLVDTLTPDGGDWDYYAPGLDTCTIHYTDFESTVNHNPYYMRMLKITFGNQVFYKGLLYSRPFERETIYFDDELSDAYISIGTAETTIVAPAGYAEITFKVELYSGYGDAGLVSYPLLKEYGGGSSLPTPTAADVGATIIVGADATEPPEKDGVIVPEQTVVIEWDEVEVTGASPSSFTVGSYCIGVINGTEYYGQITDADGGSVAFYLGDDIWATFFVMNNKVWFISDNGTYDIALYARKTAYSYKTEQNPYILTAKLVDGYLNVTLGQVRSAVENGKLVQIMDYAEGRIAFVTSVGFRDMAAISLSNSVYFASLTFQASGEDDYPHQTN